ncbi:MAG: hypothetical protein HY694_12685 [Deltaproteobacteria bacterium]|nr:hypothetical protein [Deltaproteobacteria bacterium]
MGNSSALKGAFHEGIIEKHEPPGLQDRGDLKHGKAFFVQRSKFVEFIGAEVR